MNDEQSQTLVPEAGGTKPQVGWWNPDQVYNNLHFLLSQNQASYATHLFITHPRARLGLLESLAKGASAEVFADGISAVYKWLKEQHEVGSLPFSFEQLWLALLPILRGSHQRKTLEAQMLRKQASAATKDTGVYPQMGSTRQAPASPAVDEIRTVRTQRESGENTPSRSYSTSAMGRAPHVGEQAVQGEPTHASSAPRSRRMRGSQSKYYTGNFPRVEQIGPDYRDDISSTPSQTDLPGANAWFREQSTTPQGPGPGRHASSSRQTPTGQFPRIGSAEAATPAPHGYSSPSGQFSPAQRSAGEATYPHMATPTGQFPRIGSSASEDLHIRHAMSAPRLISQVPGFQFERNPSPQHPQSSPYAQMEQPQRTQQTQAAPDHHQATMPSPQRPTERAAQEQVQAYQQRVERSTQPAQPAQPTPAQPSAQSTSSGRFISPEARRHDGLQRAQPPRASMASTPQSRERESTSTRPRQIESIGPIGPTRRSASGTFRAPGGPTSELPMMGSAVPKGRPAPQPQRRPPGPSPRTQPSPQQSERIIPRSEAAAQAAARSASQLQAAPRNQQLVSRYPLDNPTPHWDEHRIFNVLSLRILNDALASEMLAFIEQPENTQKLMQALHEAAQIKQEAQAIEELYHWHIFNTYQQRKDWPVFEFWTILRSLLLESMRKNKRNQPALHAAATHISLDNLDSASPSMRNPLAGQDLRPRSSPRPPAKPVHVASDDEFLIFDEPVMYSAKKASASPQQVIIDILSDVETIEFD